MYNVNRINSELKRVIKDFMFNYKKTCRESREDYLDKFGGDTQVYIPKDTEICTKEARESFTQYCSDCRRRVSDILAPVYKDLEAIATEPPTTEAVNAITLFQMRDDIDAGAIDMMIKRYGNNATALNAIVSIAKQHGMHNYLPHPSTEQIQALKSLEGSFARLFNSSAIISNGLEDWQGSAMEQTVDSIVQVED